MATGHSPYTQRAIEYVTAHPGCTKWDLASALTRHRLRCPSKQYYLVNTQIRLGHLVAVRLGNRYELYTIAQAVQLRLADKCALDRS